jgi:HTH-type transcriptional regulator/antitoxin HipB
MPTLRELRRRAGLSQAELAQRAGISRVTLARIETGTQMAMADTAHRICQALGLDFPDVEEFRGRIEPPSA